MLIEKDIDVSAPLTEEQIKMLEALKTRPVVPDEENPELTDEELDRMIENRRIRLALQRKQVVSIRLSNRALHVAKSFGKGYTSVLSHILEKTLTDASLLKNYM
ncbi:BrnA antitoxin family protein [Succinimonas sp.]|uniref:BrnA antitoxin family protein n=1 Tax=Succinimonas sp. TaxID=1936151 RepID=UPI00386C8413